MVGNVEASGASHDALDRAPGGGRTSCSELITPGTPIVRKREKERRDLSSFQRRIEPSHEPEYHDENVNTRIHNCMDRRGLTGSEEVGVGESSDRRDPSRVLEFGIDERIENVVVDTVRRRMRE